MSITVIEQATCIICGSKCEGKHTCTPRVTTEDHPLSYAAFTAECAEIDACGNHGVDYSDQAYANWLHDKTLYTQAQAAHDAGTVVLNVRDRA